MFKLFKKFKSFTYYGFPCGGKAPAKEGQRGVALLIALMTIMLMVGLVTDLIITSTVSIEMAATSRDRIRSEYLAKSGFNFALFVLQMSWGYDLFRAQPSTPAMVKQDLQDNGTSIWSMANKLPPMGSMMVDFLEAAKGSKRENKRRDDQDTIHKIGEKPGTPKTFTEEKSESEEENEEDPFKLKGVMNENVRETMKLFEDSFTIKIIDEASKINVNECYNGRCEETIQMLTALFSCPAEKAFLESKNIEPIQLAYRIKDFISDSPNTSPESGLSDKNASYSDQNPPYSTKGVPFDTVDELKLIAGWDDEIHAVFSNYLTVYPYPKGGTKSQFSSPININTIRPELLSCLIPDSRSSNCAESYAQKMFQIKKDNAAVFKSSIKDTLSQLSCLGTDTSLMKTATGEKMDPTTWFDQKSSVFRIEVNSTTGKQDRKLIAIVRRIMPQDKSNQRDQQQVKRSYQILHWNLL